MWQRILEWAHRAYPVLMLIVIACAAANIADHDSALSFGTRHTEARFQRMVEAGRSPTVSDVEGLKDQLLGAADAAAESAQIMRWLFTVGVFGYLLMLRDTWRFKALAFGLVVVTLFAQTFFYPLY